jgi:hypothetical protein
MQSKINMKNNLKYLLSGIIISSTFFSCDNTEPFYNQTFTRYAIVREYASEVKLDFDCTDESATFSNFKSHDDLATFGVHNGSHVLVRIQYDISSSSNSNPYSIESMDTLKTTSIDTVSFQDSLDVYFYFQTRNLGIEYPSVWCVDNYLNLSFSYFPNATNPNLTKFYLCPKDVVSDTLRMRLISENTDTTITSAYSIWRSYDMLSLLEIEPNNNEVKTNLDNIITTLQNLPNDSIFIEVATSDSLHIFDNKLYGGKWRRVSGSKRVVKMKNFYK